MARSRSASPSPNTTALPPHLAIIERLFLAAGWTRLTNPSGHTVFFSYAHNVLAIDAVRRNCYIRDGRLLPFDVILREPDEALESSLRIYPD